MHYLKWTSALATIAVALSHAGSATAQDAPVEEAERAGNDIIVTARRVEERLQDVPISITVFNQEQLSNRNVVTASDLAAFTPSLAVNQRWGPEKSSFSIRGFVQEMSTAPSVGVYFADVVAPRAYGGTTGGGNAPVGSFMDLQNVQVLKGPQGTLFGRNTTGGAVLLVPQRPTDRLEGSIEGSVGDFGMRRLQGVINVPLADTFKVRLAVDRNHRRGYLTNRSGIGPKDYNDIDYFAARLSILAELTPDLENHTIATYSNSFANGLGIKIVACNPNPPPGSAAFLTALPACDQIARQTARGDGPYDLDVNAPDAYTKIKNWGVINTTTWRVSDTLTIKNIASYQEYREQYANNIDGDNFFSRFPPSVPLPNGLPFQYVYLQPPTGGYNAIQSTFTEELQFQGGTADQRLTWQAGAYLEDSSPLGFNKNNFGIFARCGPGQLATLTCSLGLPAFLGASFSNPWTKYWYRGRGLYGQGTFKLTDQLSVTGGIRYTWDKVRALSWQTRLLPNAAGTTLTRVCADSSRFFLGRPGTPLPVASREQCADTFTEKSGKPTWLIDLDYKPADDVLLYAKYSRGYRAGSVNLTATALETWRPETVDAYEIGAKASFAAGPVRGYFNIAAFHNDFKDQQIFVTAIPDSVNFPGITALNPIINAGRSKIQGAEVDASATLFGSLKFDVGYTYLKTKLKSITVPAVPVGSPYLRFEPVAVAGGPLSFAPKHRLTITGTYSLPVPAEIGEVSVGATFTYTSRQFISANTLPEYQYLPPSYVLNLNVNWDEAFGQPVDLSVFVTNVTDKVYPLTISGSYSGSGAEFVTYAPPRMFGVRARYRFGQ